MTAAHLLRHGVSKAFNFAILGLMLAMLATLSFVAVDTNLDDLEVTGRSSRTAMNCDELMAKGSSTRPAAGAHETGGAGCKVDISFATAILLPRAEPTWCSDHPTIQIASWPPTMLTLRPRLAGSSGPRGPPLLT
ncbi:hypothetical protein [Blastomonas sp.]|uniref:hypothetical protein n=1 Tax=Blastomonas sp. TaxID=1909299 RepID=UPI0026362ECF|nr:hypothetical protein [Blastomonas sp.]MDM7956280.1 hypothetical protein [Blastomonas sp.]